MVLLPEMRSVDLVEDALRTAFLLRRSVRLIGLVLFSLPAFAQFMTHLSAETNRAFDEYTQKLEQELARGAQSHGTCLTLDTDEPKRKKAESGELIIDSESGSGGIAVPDGIINDWDGAMFIPGVKVEKVLDVLGDFDKHKDRFPEVIESHTVERNDGTIRGHWRVRKKKVITVVLDIDQVTKRWQIHPGCWKTRAATTSISEIEDAGTPQEHKLPPGEGHGFLWRLNGYWSLEQTASGVYVECRTVSLSRSIPFALRFVVKPFVESMPRESLISTLEGVRKAAKE
jgi:hypothetical protein